MTSVRSYSGQKSDCKISTPRTRWWSKYAESCSTCKLIVCLYQNCADWMAINIVLHTIWRHRTKLRILLLMSCHITSTTFQSDSHPNTHCHIYYNNFPSTSFIVKSSQNKNCRNESREGEDIEQRAQYTSMCIVIFFHSIFVFFLLPVLPRLTYFHEFSMNASLIFARTFCYFPPLISHYTCSSYFLLLLFIDPFSPLKCVWVAAYSGKWNKRLNI